ncbi:Neural-cadherin [Fragariocoptes setiger]|uniref:Neural-cadherin n=1 Tax=Fragariocoptes setiger TaxID=1670756 RepID=A0ABQ7SA35_9ACAR|nr:Neural-cadherin [Fragariocoptes setiger]
MQTNLAKNVYVAILSFSLSLLVSLCAPLLTTTSLGVVSAARAPYFVNRPTPFNTVVSVKALPGTVVYKLQARGEEIGHNIRYILTRDRTGGRFEVDERTGEIRTKGTQPFDLDKEYLIYVKAQDFNQPLENRGHASTDEVKVSIMGGRRPPQFYMEKYAKTIPEDFKKDADVIDIKAKSFADREIKYTLTRIGSKGVGTFTIDPNTGRVKLAKELDYEDSRQAKVHQLQVEAAEDSGGLTSKVDLIISISDVNDNAPRFELPDYQVYNVKEDVKPGHPVTRILATDADSGANAEIQYSLDRSEFIIDAKGNIKTTRRLDADVNNTYVLTVKATDKGTPPLVGSATVRIYTENTNDEAPKFSQEVYTPNVDENAGPKTLVTTVVASDKDGDNVFFGFAPGSRNPMFQIDERTGVIRLSNGPIVLDKDKYELNVTAKDDGHCCPDGDKTIHVSTAVVVVFITDVNDNKPQFEDCSSLTGSIQEGAPSGTSVITVKATDQDKGHNGEVRYSIVQQPNQKGTKFLIDERTGEIKSNKVFDREGDDGRFVSITVKAVDRGTPPLEGVCSFKVEITDLNDNPPLFDRQEYHENVRQDTPTNAHILRVSASDEDADLNGAITYSLAQTSSGGSDNEYFSINSDSGWITLRKPLDRDSYRMTAIAMDRGTTVNKASVEVVIDVVDRANNPPIWDRSVYITPLIKENADIGTKITSIKASSGIPSNPTVFYTLIKGSTEQTNKRDTFYLNQRSDGIHTWADILLNYHLDYEKIQQYNLTVRVENDGAQQLASECTVFVQLEDVNDEIPLFIEREQQTVSEGMPTGTRVTQVQAIDKDGTSPNNKVYYELVDGESNSFFWIDRNTGDIYTKVEFDREEKQAYAVSVKAYDGAPSNRPNVRQGDPNSVTKSIRIGIGDKNDNPPYFDQALYEAEVNEDEDIQHTVITVTAKDKDESSKLRYEMTKGNIGGAFAVNNETGAIYVAGPLDYELRKEYKLVLVASDNLNENSTTVVIRVKDVNDNPPTFDRPTYQATIVEGDDKNLPKKILQVTATDGDRDRPQNIVYFLTDQGSPGSVSESRDKGKYFSINSTSGEINVEKALDRDAPHGRSQWRFTVYAEDEGGHNGLVGYADVLVNLKDINDNAPFFPNSAYVGEVIENGVAGLGVMTITASDYDDPNEGQNAKLKYAIEQNQVNENGDLIFKIDEETGVISTNVCCLDRETNPDYTIKVTATDGGGLVGSVAVMIRVKDVNDKPPKFTKKEWFVEVDETESDKIQETPIALISVYDEDLLETNRFSYKVLDNGDFGSDKFTMVTNSDGTGSLKVAKPLDFEDLQQRYGFNITISVNDQGIDDLSPDHSDTAKVFIRLRDINDNRPIFVNQLIDVAVKEDSPINTWLANFTATDPDQGGLSKVTYAIDRSSNKRKQFRIHPEKGSVFIQRELDREHMSRHFVKILAKDDGFPSKTATATLTVIVEDVNDNEPKFLKDYRPIIYENQSPQRIEEILAADADDRHAGNGPPFQFSLDPNAASIIKTNFDVQQDLSQANSDGVAIVSSRTKLDREHQKEYHLPIIIKDNGAPSLSGTSTLTVIVGDVNDNRMHPGSKTIFVYNYKGQYQNIPIGRVHVEDPDDWDLPDKSFYWENTIAHPNFDLDPNNGTIFMRNVTEGTYLLRFHVYDRIFSQDVTANVTVNVRNLPDEAVFNSGSIRMSGITDEDFIRIWDWKSQRQVQSKYDLFRETLSKILKASTDNIDIFSVMTTYKKGHPPETDVRFAAHGSPYHKAVFLDGYVALNRRAIEKELGVNITMVGIDECLNEFGPCDGSCHNTLKIEPFPYVVNANRTALVGVHSKVVPKCECNARKLDEIEGCDSQPQICQNGGRCVMQNRIATCECPEGYTGPQCQLTSRSFDGQESWAWFAPLEQCEESHLSIEILTESANGLILYNGPVDAPQDGLHVYEDFISLELYNGRPKLIIDLGSGTSQIEVQTPHELSDGEWHRLDVFWNREEARLVVDRCEQAKVDDDVDPPRMDRSQCEGKANIRPYNEFLNVNTPLQLGGAWHIDVSVYFKNWFHLHGRTPFKGCMQNLIHNSRLYDLGTAAGAMGSLPGCSILEERCQANSLAKSCQHGQCIGNYRSASCVCDPGFMGPRCNIPTPVKMFQQSSFMRYALSFDPNPFKTDIQMRFRTRKSAGELVRLTGSKNREYAVLELKDKHLQFRYQLNGLKSAKETSLELPGYPVNDGQWHTVHVTRYGSTATIEVDRGGGRRFNETTSFEGHQYMSLSKQNLMTVGGEVSYGGPGTWLIENGLVDTCVSDIRLEQRHLPMENGSENAAVTEYRNIIDGCPSTSQCSERRSICSPPFVCVDLWNHYECMCPAGLIPSEDGNCTDDNECLNDPCANGGTCLNLDNGQGFYCVCPEEYSGDLCNASKQEKVMRLSSIALAAIMICIANVFILAVVLYAFAKSKRLDQKYGQNDLDDDVRENIISYDDEGGGEDDMHAYDITPLRIPVDATGTPISTSGKTMFGRPGILKDMRHHDDVYGTSGTDYGGGRYFEPDDAVARAASVTDPKPVAQQTDDLRNYTYEGCGSTAGSLSSLASGGEDQELDFDYLNRWGPRFERLAHFYGQSDNPRNT